VQDTIESIIRSIYYVRTTLAILIQRELNRFAYRNRGSTWSDSVGKNGRCFNSRSPTEFSTLACRARQNFVTMVSNICAFLQIDLRSSARENIKSRSLRLPLNRRSLYATRYT